MSATIDVFYYTGPHTGTLLPNAEELIGRLSPARRMRLAKRVKPQRSIELAALRMLELAMEVRGHQTFALADVEYPEAAGVTEKPFWAKGDVEFSISHAKSIAAVAIAARHSVGIDVETRRPIEPRIVRRLLRDDASLVEGLNEHTAVDSWTRIEAVLKAAGLGVMHGKEIDWQPHAVRLRGREWYVRTVECGPGYSAHIATDSANATVNVIRVEIL